MTKCGVALRLALAATWLLRRLRGTALEDLLETENDPRLPASFRERLPSSDAMLETRPRGGFSALSCIASDGSETSVEIGNWERFAMSYWYETRRVNCSCPMTPTGIATYADWALLVPCLFGDMAVPPRLVFVHTYMLSHFVESPLRLMPADWRFVLLSGGTDLTVPGNIDLRYHYNLRGFQSGETGGKYFQWIVDSPHVIHWFAENHNLRHAKLSTLPSGLSTGSPTALEDLRRALPARETIAPLAQRALRVLVAHRTRGGRGQWAVRAEVNSMCEDNDLCLLPPATARDEGMPYETFAALLVSVPFVACVHGGGMDPSPKAWEAIIAGTIPIVERNALEDGYARLPVLFVDSWAELLAPENRMTAERILSAALTRLAPFYEEGSELRKKTLHKLTMDYWVDLMLEKVRDYDLANGLQHNSSQTGS